MKVLLILGNGFSIDFVKSCLPPEANIDTTNLFSKGAGVPAPGGYAYGFLSAKHAPALWALNARPYVGSDESLRIFEDVLSAAQTYFAHDKKKSFVGDNGVRSTHLRAYCELSYYLRALFIKYDLQRDRFNGIDAWPWARFFKTLANAPHVDEVVIVTYNYDLWLERVFDVLDIPFTYAMSSGVQAKFVIYKPHGSINFIAKDQLPVDLTEVGVNYLLELQDIPKAVSATLGGFEKYWMKYTLIPPAADSGRLGAGWNGALRKNLLTKLIAMPETVRTIVCGLSYWHVDRQEIDEVLCATNPDSEVLMINPTPPSNLDAVLTTVFKNYTCSLGSEILTEVGNEL